MKRPIRKISVRGKTCALTMCLNKHGGSEKREVDSLGKSEYTQLESTDE